MINDSFRKVFMAVHIFFIIVGIFTIIIIASVTPIKFFYIPIVWGIFIYILLSFLIIVMKSFYPKEYCTVVNRYNLIFILIEKLLK